MLGALNAYEKDLLREYQYRLFKCSESAQGTTDAKLCVLLSKRGTVHIQRSCLRNLYSTLDHGNIYGIELVKQHCWQLIFYDYVGAEQLLARSIECI